MAKLNILFLTYCYPPQRFPRSVQISHLVNYLKTTFNIEVITSPPGKNVDKSLEEFTSFDNVAIANLGFITKFMQQGRGHRIKKNLLPDLFYFWHFDLLHKAEQKIKQGNIDIIFTFGQPMSTHMVGKKLKQKFPHLKWFAHFSDPWIDNIFNEYNVWTKYINTRMQNAVFAAADQLIFTSDETVKLVTRNYPNAIIQKCTSLAHSFNAGLYNNINSSNQSLTIRYLGNFYGARQPHALFKALQQILHELDNIKIELVGANSSDLQSSIIEHGLQKLVSVIPAVNYLQSLDLAASSDLLLVIDAPTESSPFLPSKLIDYIGANKPIFAITPAGTSKNLIEEMGFLTAHPHHHADIATKLLQMITKIRSGNMHAIPTHIRNRYDVQNIGQELAELIVNKRL